MYSIDNNNLVINKTIICMVAINGTEWQTASILNQSSMDKKAALMQHLAQVCRVKVFDLLYQRGNGHWGGSASAAELLTSLYYHCMNIDPSAPLWPERDRLILSKGHAAPMLYTLLAMRGYFGQDELETLRQLNSRLQGHPCMKKTAGVEMSTGALGHGLSVGLGMSLSAVISKKQFWTFVILGDGCLNEGQTWEAVMSAAKFAPPRLAILIDYNKVQLDGPSSQIMNLDPLAAKFRAFNLNTCDQLIDGHDVTAIMASWEWMKANQQKPCVVIYRTTKGKGVSFMENNHVWHGATIDDQAYTKGKIELENRLLELKTQL